MMQSIERNGGKSTVVLKKVGNDCLYLYLFYWYKVALCALFMLFKIYQFLSFRKHPSFTIIHKIKALESLISLVNPKRIK